MDAAAGEQHEGPAEPGTPAAATAPVPPARWLVPLVGGGLFIVLLVAALLSFWVAGLLLATLLVGLGAARLVLPVSALGPLAVRDRWVDVATCLVLGVSVAVLAVLAPR